MTRPTLFDDFYRSIGLPVPKRRRRIIRQQGATQELNASLKKQEAWKENNDCTVRAISIATGLPYEKCHDALAKAGRKNGRGCTPAVQDRALHILGFSKPVLVAGKHATLRKCNGFPKVKTYCSVYALPKRGRFLIYTTGHVAAFTEGQLHDYESYLNTRRQVLGVYRVTK